MLVLIFEIIT